MIERFDDHLLNEFAHGFYGYGNYSGDFWFIGMEEGGGNSFAEIAKRLSIWAKRGKREIEDVAEYHVEIGITHFFNDSPKLQPTWNKLIRILLSHDNQVPTTEQVREYQRTVLGRSNGSTCLVELLPLPSPSTGHWLYARHSHLPYLANRATYKRTCLPPRILHLKQRINEHEPKAVIFYGLSYWEHWQEIAGVNFLPESDGLYIGHKGASLFIVTKHPAAKGVTSEYFHQVGKMIAVQLRNP
jgi:hypothetical protein